MTDMPDLGKQIGPLPLGAWIAVVAGGLGIAYYTRNNSGGDTTDTTASGTVVDDTGTPNGVGDGTVGGWTPTTPSSGGTDPAITDNDSWGNAAINYLVAQGYDPAWSYSAITKALAGGRGENRLSVREYSLWRAALRHLGAPPTPITIPPPTPINQPHKPQNPPRKPPIHQGGFFYARVTPKPMPGSTLKSLANMYYRDPNKWHRIYEANQSGHKRADGTPGMIKDPNKLHVGWKLLIPR